MKKNIGAADKYIRIALGIVIIIAGIYFKSWWGALAVIPMATAFSGLCPLYKILGANTK
ncbi:MAG: DUF2892 domain-containing protein [Ginsengibacter sp.]